MDMREPDFPAKITARTLSGGLYLYSWTEQIATLAGTGYQDASPARSGNTTVATAYERNNQMVAVNTLVWMRFRGFNSSAYPVYDFDASDGTSTGNLTVAEQDGSPSYTSTTSIVVDQADGFVLTQPSANTVRIDLQAATTSQAGIVSTSAQTIGGVKTFNDGMAVALGQIVDLGGGNTNPATWVQRTDNGSIGGGSNDASLLAAGTSGGTYSVILSASYPFNGAILRGSTNPKFAVYDGTSLKTGAYGTDTVGNVFSGGLCTTVGAGVVGTVTHTAGALTAHCVVVGNGTNDEKVITAGTNGQVLIGQTGADPAFTTIGTDATLSAAGALTIANDAVTYAKMQNISATSRVLGRKTAGSGDTEECTLSEVLDFIGSAAQGDVLYRGASAWARLGAGTSGYHLTTGGAGADVAWTVAKLASTSDVTFSSPSWSTNGTYVSCSCSITVGTGKWLLMASVLGHIQFSTGASGNMQWRLQDTTNGATLLGGTGNAHYVVVQPTINVIAYDDDAGFVIVDTSGSTTIEIQVTTNTATVWTSRDLDHAELVAIQIG